MHRTPSRRLGAAASVLGLVLSGCGSQLTEDEVLARAGIEVAAAPVTPIASTAPAGQTTEPATTGISTPATDPGTQPVTGPTVEVPATAGTSGPAPATDPGAGPPALAAAGPCTTGATGPIVVGNVGNYSGAGGSSQAGFQTGVQMWAATVNQRGGICGREVQIISQDDGSDPARYGALVRDLVENQGVVAFVGNAAVLSVQGGIDYHKSSGVPVIGNDCTSDIWYGYPLLAPTCADPYTTVSGTVRNAVDITGSTKFGHLWCTEAKACVGVHEALVAGAIADAGATAVYEASVSITQIDFTAECRSAADAKVEIFWVAADPATVSRAARSCARQGFFPQWVSGSVSFGPESVAEEGLGDTIVMNPVFPFAGAAGHSPAIDEYETARATYAPQVNPGPALSIAWASGKLFEVVAEAAARQSGEITPDTLAAALLTIEGETLGGLVPALTFTPNGPKHDPCYFALQGDGTGAGFTTPLGNDALCH